MQKALSVAMITKNAQELLAQSLGSVQSLAGETIVVDDGSTDDTRKIATHYKAKIYSHHEIDLGKQKAYALAQTKGEWVLVLDSDEIVSEELKKEIRKVIFSESTIYDGYRIPYENHFLGKKIRFGGENYAMVRLARKNFAKVGPALVHEQLIITKGKIGRLHGKIRHYSYRSLLQTYRKFTDYALREAREKKKQGIKTNLLNVFSYPIHMFLARFIKDKGYKDGLFRIPLDLGFAYMEFVVHSYLLLS